MVAPCSFTLCFKHRLSLPGGLSSSDKASLESKKLMIDSKDLSGRCSAKKFCGSKSLAFWDVGPDVFQWTCYQLVVVVGGGGGSCFVLFSCLFLCTIDPCLILQAMQNHFLWTIKGTTILFLWKRLGQPPIRVIPGFHFAVPQGGVYLTEKEDVALWINVPWRHALGRRPQTVVFHGVLPHLFGAEFNLSESESMVFQKRKVLRTGCRMFFVPSSHSSNLNSSPRNIRTV